MPSGSQKRLSSSLTFIYKFVFPTVWLAGFALATVSLAVGDAPGGPGPLPFGAGLVLGAILFWRWCFPLQDVVATDRGLLVSNFRRTVLVPYDRIAGVYENKFVNTHPITVFLRGGGELGDRFVFMPYTAFALFSDHPAAKLLRERVRGPGTTSSLAPPRRRP